MYNIWELFHGNYCRWIKKYKVKMFKYTQFR
jgi:hypothetical protein